MAPPPDPAATAAAATLAAAEATCAEAGRALTPLRRRVYELLLASGGPAGAYDVLAALRAERPDAKPPTVYRALDFLVTVGLAHRLESLNAFVACDAGHAHAPSVFLICTSCRRALEVDAGHALVDVTDAAAAAGFHIARTMFEASGVCASCRPQE